MAATPAMAGKLERLIMPGKLFSGHAEYEGECSSCHVRFSKASQSNLCLKCHRTVAGDLKKMKGYHGLSKEVKGKECQQCHTDHKGREADIVLLDKEVFDHRISDFPLNGSHKNVKCSECHILKTKYRNASSNCAECHKDDDPHLGRLGNSCGDCHVERTWTDTRKARFNHAKTEFSLEGAHEKLACNSCHPNERYKSTPKDCFSCHRLNDVHAGSLGRECKTCHTTVAWKSIIFNHDGTGFALKGKHNRISCDQCHAGRDSGSKPEKTCYGCHRDDDEHSGRFGKECQTCHRESDWKRTIFNHKVTDFTLKGKHSRLGCDRCHRGPVYETKPEKTCYGCHRDEDEHGGRYGMACETCHRETGWKDSIFSHEKNLRRTCYDCHRQDDVHRGQQGRRCDQCHSNLGWRKKLFFDHDLVRFPLIGLHAVASCEECHLGATYKNTPMDCLSCHKSEDHHKQSLGTGCGLCHNPNGWDLWQYDHNSQTDFVLDGAHEGLECQSCHQNPVKSKITAPTNCSGCHQRDDTHRGALGLMCDRCHTTRSFQEINMAP